MQAIRLTESVFRRMSPPPLRPVEKVAPVVYALLIEDVDPTVIEQALINARAHTADGISYALRQIAPPIDKAAVRRTDYWQERPRYVPSDEERSRVQEIIDRTRKMLRGEK